MDIKIKKPKLTTYQQAFLYNPARFTVTEASTKVGKTYAHIWWIFERAHEPWNKEGYNHWWIAPVYNQTKIAFKRLRAKLAPTGIYKINESNLTITCPNGAVIHFKSAEKPDNLFGEDVYSVVFDEAPRARQDAYFALRSTITATKGMMKLIGNFGGTANWVHQLKEKAKTDKEFAYFKVTAWEAVAEGILEEEEILQAQRDLPPKIFKQLYLAEEQESDDQLISFEVMNSFFTNDFVPHGDKYITADLAFQGSDLFEVIVWSGFRIIYYDAIAKSEGNEIENKIKELAKTFAVQRHNIAYDADGGGNFLQGYLQGSRAFHNGSSALRGENYKNLKSQCGYWFARQANGDGIYIDPIVDIDKGELFKQLECLQSYELDKEGKMQIMPKAKIKEIIGRSPDTLDALIMRMIFEIQKIDTENKGAAQRRETSDLREAVF